MRRNLPLSKPTPLWILISVGVGLGAVILPYPLFMALITVMIFLITGLITPIAALVILLVFAPLRTLLLTELSFYLPIDIGQALAALFLLVALWWRQSAGKSVWALPSPIYLPLILFILLSIPSMAMASSLSAWLSEWLKWVVMLIFALAISALGRYQSWEAILFALIISGIANACVGYYIFFGGSGADHLLINDRFFRAFGTFGQPNPFGGFMGLLAPLALMTTIGYIQRAYNYWRKTNSVTTQQITAILFYASATLLLVGGVFISWSRGAWLGFLFACGFLAFALPKRLKTSLLYSGMLATIVLALWFSGLMPDAIVQRVSSSTEEFFAFDDMRGVDITPDNYAVAERLAHWQAAINMATENPWLGVGLGHYEIAYNRYRLINWDEPLGHAHNFYLNILAEAGIIGFLSYIGLWVSITSFTWKARRHPDFLARAVTVGLLGCWFYLAFHSLLDNLFVNNLFIHLGVMLGILVIIERDTRYTLPAEQL